MLRPPHTAWRIVSSAISFRLPPDSISADASSGSPLSSDFLWAVHSTTYAASFPLSDLRCFRFLSSASVLDSDYSASALPFLFFPVLPHSCFPGAPSPLSLPRFPPSLRPGFPCLPSGFLYSASLLVSFCPSLIHSHSCSSGAYLVLSLSVFPLPLRFLSSASLPVPATQPLFLPFLFLPVSASQWLIRCCLSAFRLPCFSPSAPPGFPCFASASSYSACLFVSFHPTRFRSHSRFPGASLPFRFLSSASLPGFSLASLSFVRSRSVLTTQPSVFLFPSSRFPLSAVLSVLPLSLAASLLFL